MRKDLLVQLDLAEILGLLVLLVHLENEVSVDHQDLLVTLDNLGLLVLAENGVQLETQEAKGLLGHLDPLVPPDLLDLSENVEKQVHLDREDLLVSLVSLVHQEAEVLPGLKVHQDQVDLLAHQDQWEHVGNKEKEDLLDHQDLVVKVDHQVHLALLELLDHLDHPEKEVQLVP